MGKPKRSGSGLSNDKPTAATKQQVAKSSADHAVKGKQAVALINQGKLEEAEAIYRELIAAGTRNHAVYGNLAAICGMQGRFGELIELLKKALEIVPNYPEAHNNLGNAHKEQGNLDAAIASYNTALQLKPDYPDAHYNLGNAHKEQGELDAAIASYNTALQLKPNYPDAHYNLGNALQEQGNLDAAIDSYNTALQLKPNYPEAHWNSALTMLLGGDYKNGWVKYEWRHKKEKNTVKPHALPKCIPWGGEPALNQIKQLLLVTEQGIGDTLQFMRYVNALRQQGATVSFCAQPKLHTLIQASAIDPSPLTPKQANQVSEGQWVPLLSVPRHLGVSPGNPVINEPYIKTTDELIAKWADTLEAEQRPIIGINWQGNPKAEKAGLRGRSIKLETFAPIIGGSQISLLSLQKGFGSEQLETCSFKDRFISCQDQVNDTWDFLETAAIIANCDLVITSDTSVAHLAGGMGKTTWLLLQKVPEWRWGLEGETTFWYPSMRLFRQKERGNWNEVMERVTEALQMEFPAWGAATAKPGHKRKTATASLASHRKTSAAKSRQEITAPISLGELIDKITILEIKTQHLQGTSLENVKKELNALETTLKALQLDIDPPLVQRLKEVNQDLWEIEDNIRDQERQKNFGETFIRMARSVYQQNDRRAAIKKEINTTYGSAFVEEKSYEEYAHKNFQQAKTHIAKYASAWETLAITLEPKGQRYLEFKSNNKHLAIAPFTALRGTDIPKEEVIRQGIATEELVTTPLLTPGAVGCAASHRAIWARCSNGNKGFLVLEDDCYTHPNINDFIEKNIERLMSADICLFGVNTDSILKRTSQSNLTTLSLFEPKNPTPRWIRAALSKTDIRNVEIHKLEKAFGCCAYFVSPKGAHRLDTQIFPLSLKTTNIPLITDKMPLISIDRSGCSIYSQMDALICEPFLAYTPNINSSTKTKQPRN